MSKYQPQADQNKTLDDILDGMPERKHFEPKSPEIHSDSWDWMENFNLKPHELVAYLDQYIVRQDKAKATLATKICTHFNRIRYLKKHQESDPSSDVGLIKNNVLLIGPTGVGKTYLIKLIASRLGVPFVKADATKFSETGYVGGDVEDLVRELVQEADGDLEKAQYGIIYLDEVDKIASSHGLLGPDVSRAGVQRALLKPMEETTVNLKPAHDPVSQIQAIEQYRRTGKVESKSISTRHMLFIMSGAFGSLTPIIKKRLNQKTLGFGAAMQQREDDYNYLAHTTNQDLVGFGFENEFIGRLPVLAILDNLSKEDLLQIMQNPNNPVMLSKRRDFAAYGIELHFTNEALTMLAAQAESLGTGARALVSVLEAALTPFEHNLPAHPEVSHLVVTPQVVEDPPKALQAILAEPNLQAEHRKQAIEQTRANLLSHMKTLRGKGMLKLPEEYWDVAIMEDINAVLPLNRAIERMAERLAYVDAFADAYFEEQQMIVRFDVSARQLILAQGPGYKRFINEFMKVLIPGLALVNSRLGLTSFNLPALAISDTDSYLRKLFEEHYQDNLPG